MMSSEEETGEQPQKKLRLAEPDLRIILKFTPEEESDSDSSGDEESTSTDGGSSSSEDEDEDEADSEEEVKEEMKEYLMYSKVQ